jgi:thiol-disulfide isomerase/thioredoxin
MENHLLEFYGTECPHCVRMHELVERLEKEEGIKVESLEVWHNEANEKRLLELDKDMCGGVPFFYNTKTNKFICGETDYATMKKWAKGEEFTQE